MDQNPVELFRAGDIVYHGSFKEEAACSIIRHYYGHSDCEDDIHGFAELLELPEEKRIVIHVLQHAKRGRTVYEFPDLNTAQVAWKQLRWDSLENPEGLLKEHQMRVHHRPWFYKDPTTL